MNESRRQLHDEDVRSTLTQIMKSRAKESWEGGSSEGRKESAIVDSK